MNDLWGEKGLNSQWILFAMNSSTSSNYLAPVEEKEGNTYANVDVVSFLPNYQVLMKRGANVCHAKHLLADKLSVSEEDLTGHS